MQWSSYSWRFKSHIYQEVSELVKVVITEFWVTWHTYTHTDSCCYMRCDNVWSRYQPGISRQTTVFTVVILAMVVPKMNFLKWRYVPRQITRTIEKIGQLSDKKYFMWMEAVFILKKELCESKSPCWTLDTVFSRNSWWLCPYTLDNLN